MSQFLRQAFLSYKSHVSFFWDNTWDNKITCRNGAIDWKVTRLPSSLSDGVWHSLSDGVWHSWYSTRTQKQKIPLISTVNLNKNHDVGFGTVIQPYDCGFGKFWYIFLPYRTRVSSIGAHIYYTVHTRA